ncbi:NYN domain-containing protein [Helicobacter pylori]|uniref:NYN domain-containing protein n=1 Tax=Helicobacter pylori TaxID=210 RepID=UPI00046D232D|nr:NYN domain-containing protein [Helicobacter pylori]MBM0603005.1 NYN domain-containing protein [Helicobacter pylori]MBM0610356.1 NYN domain-containing protein [Helicobacter pylori]MBM0619602.1 NYN domain-containing protein [Helicobacter pylori]MBM0626890.1 NYN domain-containing protein [Helicobacter pylori]UEA55877.1 NYN domain-containing protein [Helicobacter pylori]
MEKTETTIFVDWQNLLTDLRAIQETDERFKESHFNFNNPDQLLALIRSFLEPEEMLDQIYFYVSEPFTEAEPRIKGNKNKELEEYKKNNFKEYEERVNKSGIIQSFNHEIAQQNQVELRVGRVKYKFEDISEEERHFGMEIRTNQERLDLRQKGIDTLLVHDIAKICYTATSRCVLLFSKDTDFAPVFKEIREQGFKIFIARIKESPISVPSDLKKSCGVRKCSVAEIVAKLPKNQHTPKKNNFPPKEPFNNPFKDKLPKKN